MPVWSGMNLSGTGVTVAIVDDGIDSTHPDLQHAWVSTTVPHIKEKMKKRWLQTECSSKLFTKVLAIQFQFSR